MNRVNPLNPYLLLTVGATVALTAIPYSWAAASPTSPPNIFVQLFGLCICLTLYGFGLHGVATRGGRPNGERRKLHAQQSPVSLEVDLAIGIGVSAAVVALIAVPLLHG